MRKIPAALVAVLLTALTAIAAPQASSAPVAAPAGATAPSPLAYRTPMVSRTVPVGRTPLAVRPLSAAPAPALARTSAVGPLPPSVRSESRLGRCEAGRVCLWRSRDFTGRRYAYELADVTTGDCVRLPTPAGTAALANRTGRPVTVYQSPVCAETGEFSTYPSGSWAPESPYAVRAFKVWER
ncbi:peptidase inhibitor family I36 protein [Streptomyces sparsus]